jgi:formylglycine-generating enzyme required for sulfatase activity/serine/threonine protein kinase
LHERNLNALPPGTLLDGYRIERELGSGGFGITYLAVEVESGRKVAIKEYMPKAYAQRGPGDLSVRPVNTEARDYFEWGLERFRDEARALIRLHHPNIVLTLRLFSAHGTAYIVMNYVEGASLKDLLQGGRTLPEAETRALLEPLLDALGTVHEAGYLHRDLKPANIFIRSADGRPVVLDFGAAREALGRETKTLSAIVTPGYSPPEQYGRGVKQKESADIYALAATLYRCVTGEAPPEAPDRVSAMVMSQPDLLLPAAEAARGKYSPALLAAIDAGLCIRENERPPTVAAFRALLRGAAPRPPAPAAERAVPRTEETLLAGSARAKASPHDASGNAPSRQDRANLRAARLMLAAAAAALVLSGVAVAYVVLAPSQRGATEVAAVDSADATRKANEEARRQAEERAQAEAEAKRRAEEAERPRTGTVFRDCAECPEMVVLPAGAFTMGSDSSEGFSREGPQRTIVFAKPLAMGKYEVTFTEFDLCVHDRGCPRLPEDGGWGRDRRPVIHVSWDDAQAYVEWLAKKTGKPYRLPSEAEWEYAARAGTTTRYSWGDRPERNHANCDGCGSQWDGRKTAPVGSFAPNAFGLHDMHGNVAEWSEDCWNADHAAAAPNGAARLTGNCDLRVVRGGSWAQFADSAMRSASRLYEVRTTRSDSIGFRVARSY